jgi:hypothetical protein
MKQTFCIYYQSLCGSLIRCFITHMQRKYIILRIITSLDPSPQYCVNLYEQQFSQILLILVAPHNV